MIELEDEKETHFEEEIFIIFKEYNYKIQVTKKATKKLFT